MPAVAVVLLLFVRFQLASVNGDPDPARPLLLSLSDLEDLVQAEGEDHAFAVACVEGSVRVVIRAPRFDPVLLVSPEHLRLGPAGAGRDRCSAREAADGEYVIRAPLSDCGSRVTFTPSSVQYSNLLLYSPPTSPEHTFPAGGVAAHVRCEYKRRYAVSSRALKPAWTPSTSASSAQLSLDFHLRLMTSDWSRERKSSVYFLGELVHIEASVERRRLPLRLFVDSCVATRSSDVASQPRYPFIDHQGCFLDSQPSGSRSRFLTRVRDDLLHIQLASFLFHQDVAQTIYVTCYLEARPVFNKGPEGKACSFTSGRWRSVDGDDRVCEACDRSEETSRRGTSATNHQRAPRSKTKNGRELKMKTTNPITLLPLKN